MRAFQADGQQMDLPLTKFQDNRIVPAVVLVELGLIVDLQLAMEKGVSRLKVHTVYTCPRRKQI